MFTCALNTATNYMCYAIAKTIICLYICTPFERKSDLRKV